MAEDIEQKTEGNERTIKYETSSHLMSARLVKSAGVYLTLHFDAKEGYKLKAVPTDNSNETIFERKYDLKRKDNPVK